jgi:hypothetical protein
MRIQSGSVFGLPECRKEAVLMSDLVLHVKKEFFDLIKSGEKKEEYRLCTPYWLNRFSDDKPPFSRVLIACGYPSKSDVSRWLSFPFTGMEEREGIIPFFGDKPVWYFAIRLEQMRRDNPALSQ